MPALARHLCLLVLLVVLASALPPARPAYALTFTVDQISDGDDGGSNACAVNGCTLREAIRLANESGGSDTIRFSVSGTIAPATPLPDLSGGGTTIDADDRSFGVVLSGLGMASASPVVPSHGLRITSANNVVRGLVIINFPRGTGFFSGGAGIFISGQQATGNAIYNNRIGIDATGNSARGNQTYGVLLDDGASDNDIGGALASQVNVISGNLVANVGLASVSGTTNLITNNRVVGNRIGTNAAGTAAVADANNSGMLGGVSIENYARSNRIEGNLIGGHTGNSRIAGIALFGDTVTANAPSLPRDNVIVGNRIGVNDSGQTIANRVGVFLLGAGRYGAIGTVIGNPDNPTAGRNYIAGNAERGIEIEDTPFETGDTIIAGNYIGIAPNNALVGNGTVGTGRGEGIYLGFNDDTSTRRTIVGPGNLIAGSRTVHIYIRSGNNIIRGNLIGTNLTGTATSATSSSVSATLGFGSGAASVWIENGANNLIGGPSAADRNVIANGGFSVKSNGAAVMIDPAANSPSTTPPNCNASPCATANNTVQGNYIGITAAGTARLNTNNSAVTDAEGIRILGSNGSTVRGNAIAGFGRGIRVDNASNGVFADNLIGTRANGSLASPLTNLRDGIRIVSGSNNRFENNLIAFNGGDGDLFVSHGVRVGLSTSSASDNQFIGNRLVTNGKVSTNHGFFVQNSQRVLISQNTTTGHFGDGISLDIATNGNNNLAAPSISAPTAANPVISGSAAGCGAGCTVEIFTGSVAEDREGPVYLTRAVTGAGGSFSANISGCLGFITATVRDATGNTSPFTSAVNVGSTGACTTPTLTLGAASPDQRSVAIGSSTTYAHTLSHNVPVTRTYNLSITSDRGWATGPALVTLPPNGSAAVNVTVSVPVGTAPGTLDTTAVQASLGSLSSTTQTDRTTAQVVSNNPAAPAVSPGQTRALGVGQTTIQFTHFVTNTGDLAGDFAVVGPSFGTGAPGTWSFGAVTLGKTRLSGGESTTLTIVVNTPGLPPATDVTFNFRVRVVGGQQTDPATVNTIDVPVVRDFAFSAVAPTSQTSTVGSQISYTYTITNTGNGGDTFQITPPGSTAPSSGITFSASPSGSFSLAAGAARQVTVTASIPTNTPANSYSFTTSAQAVGGSGAPAPKSAAPNTLIVTGGGAPEFVGDPTITPNPASATAQTDVTIVHTLRNSGNQAAPFSFGSTRPAGWTPVSQTSDCPSPVPITIGFTCTVTTVVRVPAGQNGGNYTLSVSATADNATTDVTATDEFTVAVALQRGLLFLPTPQEQSGTPGTQLTFTHTLTNTGNAADSFDLSIDQTLGGWTASVTPTAILNLPRDQSRTVTVQVTVPGALPANTLNQFTVLARSRGDSAVIGSVQDGARVLTSDGADLSPGIARTAPIGAVITFTHTLTNTGSSSIAYRIAAANSQAAWAAPVVNSPTPVLNPGEAVTVTVEVAIPAGITGGVSNVTTVQAFADGGATLLDQEQNTVLVGNQVDVLITPDRAGTVAPNSEVVFTHTVTNIGTTTDTYTVTVREASGMPAFASVDLIDLAPGQSKEISITLRVPAGNRAGADAFVRTTVSSTTDPAVKDSAVGEFTISLVAGSLLSTNQQRAVRSNSGQVTLRTLALKNIGSSPDTFDLSYEDVAGVPGGVTVSLSPTVVPLDVGEERRSISLRVTVPASIPPGGVRQVRVIATSRLDPSARSSVIIELSYLDVPPPPGRKLYMPMIAR